jgi:hypothetical protein
MTRYRTAELAANQAEPVRAQLFAANPGYAPKETVW